MSKTETQSEVQRYATLLEKYVKGASLPDFQEDMVLEAAGHLRRLDAENKALRDALECIHDTFKKEMDAGEGTLDKEFAVLVAADGLNAAKTGDAA